MGLASLVIMFLALLIEISNLFNDGPSNHLIAVIGFVVLALGWGLYAYEKKSE